MFRHRFAQHDRGLEGLRIRKCCTPERQPQVFRLRFAPLNMTRLLEIENPEAVHSGMATTGAHATTLSASFRLRSLRDLRSR